MPEIAWEGEVRPEVVSEEFQQVESYCEKLLRAAAEALMSAYDQGRNVWQAKYPQLKYSKLEAALLPGFLRRTSFSYR